MSDGAPVKLAGWVDTSGVFHKFAHSNGKQRMVTSSYGQAIVEGEIADNDPVIVSGSAVSSGSTFTDLWGGAPATPYCPVLSAAVAMEIVGGAQDTAAGTGVSKCEVHYLDGSGNAQSWTAQLTGAVAVAFPENVLHIQGVHVSEGGAAATGRVVASANIDIRGSGGGTLYERIPANQTCAPRFCFRIPAGKTGYWSDVLGFMVALNANSSGVIEIVANQDPESLAVLPLNVESCYFQQGGGSGGNSFSIPLQFPLKFNAGVVVKARCALLDGSGNVRGDIFGRGWLE